MNVFLRIFGATLCLHMSGLVYAAQDQAPDFFEMPEDSQPIDEHSSTATSTPPKPSNPEQPVSRGLASSGSEKPKSTPTKEQIFDLLVKTRESAEWLAKQATTDEERKEQLRLVGELKYNEVNFSKNYDTNPTYRRASEELHWNSSQKITVQDRQVTDNVTSFKVLDETDAPSNKFINVSLTDNPYRPYYQDLEKKPQDFSENFLRVQPFLAAQSMRASGKETFDATSSEASATSKSAALAAREDIIETLRTSSAASANTKSDANENPTPSPQLAQDLNIAQTNQFAETATQALGIQNAAGAINLAPLLEGMNHALKTKTDPIFQKIAKAELSGDTPTNIQNKVDALNRLSLDDQFQSYLKNRMPEENIQQFNYNTAAADLASSMKDYYKDFPEKVKKLIDEKSGVATPTPTLAVGDSLSQPLQSGEKFTLSKQGAAISSSSSATLPILSSNTSKPSTAPISLDKMLSIPKDFSKGTPLSADAATWIELARFLTSPEGLSVAAQRRYNPAVLAAGRKDLETLIGELRSQNSLDLVGLLQLPPVVEPAKLTKSADDLLLKYMRDFVALKPEASDLPKKSRISLSTNSPYSLGYVQKEVHDLVNIYSKLTADVVPFNDSLVTTKVQLVNALISKENVREVWNFYDTSSYQFVQRGLGNLYLSHYLISFSNPSNPLSYLYRYTLKEIGVRNQIAEERAIRETGTSTRKPASAKK